MAELLQQQGGMFCPRIICDWCQQPITDIHEGLAIYERLPEGQEATLTRVFHTHKRMDCQASVWAMAGEPSCCGLSLELSDHLVAMVAMCGLDPGEVPSVYHDLLTSGWELEPFRSPEAADPAP